MLPGFNHNIRYRDRVFHVQTEDNGLRSPNLVTQVFIGGHMLMIEKSSYGDILELDLNADERTKQVRARMQEQHKRLLKNLTRGEYDDRIKTYDQSQEPADLSAELVEVKIDTSDLEAPQVPAKAIAEAENIPQASPSTADLEVEDGSSLANDLKIAGGLNDIPQPEEFDSEEDLLSALDEEMRRQAQWSPSTQEHARQFAESFGESKSASTFSKAAPSPPARVAAPPQPHKQAPKPTPKPAPAKAPLPVGQDPSGAVPAAPAKSAKHQPSVPRAPSTSKSPVRSVSSSIPGEARTEVASKPSKSTRAPKIPLRSRHRSPPASDTLIDFNLPAGLRDQLENTPLGKKFTANKGKTPAVDALPPGTLTPHDPPKQDRSARNAADPTLRRRRVETRSHASEQRIPPHVRQRLERRDPDTQIDLDMRRSQRPKTGDLPGKDERSKIHQADTVLDMSAQQRTMLQKAQELYQSRRRQNWSEEAPKPKAEPEAPDPANADDKRPNIVVVEPSLDEVILSYLSSDDQD